MKRAFFIAILCGAIPLVVGVAIFGLWLLTRHDWLMAVGVGTILCGLVMFLVGIVAIYHFWVQALYASDYSRTRRWTLTLVAAGLLLVNFPVAGGIILAAIRIETRYTVEIHNESRETLTDVHISGGGVEETIEAIPPDSRVKRDLWFQGDDELKFYAKGETTTYEETIDSYVTRSMGGYTVVTIHADETITVEHR